MIDTLKLKGRITEKGYNYQTLAPLIGCTAYTLGQKIANFKPATLEEVIKLAEILEITSAEFCVFFLKDKLQNTTK